MLRGAALEHFAQVHGLPFLHIDDLVSYRAKHDALVVSSANGSVAADALSEHYSRPRVQA
jgi:hypothetical protein